METCYQPMTIQEVYRLFQAGRLFTPPYQREFIWSEENQQELIEGVLQGRPIGLVIVAEVPGCDDLSYEIVDGQQRLKTIFRFLENGFSVSGRYFHDDLSRNGQIALDAETRRRLLEYTLSVIVLREVSPEEVVSFFQCINTSGQPLNRQEVRQARRQGAFARTVEELTQWARRPIHGGREGGYRDSLWVRMGLYTPDRMRRQADQAMLARLALSVLEGRALARDEDRLDEAYTQATQRYDQIDRALACYPARRLQAELEQVLTVLALHLGDGEDPAFSPADAIGETPGEAFYLLCLAVHEYLVDRRMTLEDGEGLRRALRRLLVMMGAPAEHDAACGEMARYASWLVGQCFSGQESETLGSGELLVREFEDSIRRSMIETSRYELKQGFLRLSTERAYDKELEGQILRTICGIANIGPSGTGCLYIGVADKPVDAEKIARMDGIRPAKIETRYVVGIGREAALLGITVEQYCRKIKSFIDGSDLSKHLILSVLSHMDVINYQGLPVIRLVVPPQGELSYCGDDIYLRKHSETIKLTNPREIVSLARRFSGL